MARNLIAAGLSTTVWDRWASAAERLGKDGARVASFPGEAVRDAEVVITMLPTAAVVSSVVLNGGVLDAFARHSVWVQMGTMGVAATVDLSTRVHERRPDVLFVDPPVSGSKEPASWAVAHSGLGSARCRA